MFTFHHSLVKDKHSPSPPKKEEVEDRSPSLDSGANSSDSGTLDTIQSADGDEDLYNDTEKNTEDDIVDEEIISGVDNDSVEKAESSNIVVMSDNCDDDVVAGAKKYEYEPIVVQAKAEDCLLIPLGNGVFVYNLFTTIENYQLCFLVRNDKSNLLLGDFYPDRGIFVYGAYIEADALSSLRLFFINENLDSFTSISWKYFLKKQYPSATMQVKKKVNF